jgi:cytoskeletal protein RodZ
MAELTAEQKTAASSAKGSTAKKVLWWILGILGVILVIVFILAVVLRKKSPSKAVDEVIQKTKLEVDKADVAAKVKAAEAAGAEKEAVEEIKKVLEIDDADKRRERLADLLDV